MGNEEHFDIEVSEAQPFLRNGEWNRGENIVSADSDSAACSSESCSCGTGAGECAHVPKQPSPQL
jgi:hypothetical protein